jgi:hypothetical protein
MSRNSETQHLTISLLRGSEIITTGKIHRQPNPVIPKHDGRLAMRKGKAATHHKSIARNEKNPSGFYP